MVAVAHDQTELNSAQYEVVNVLSCLHRRSDVEALKSLLVSFLNERLQSELDGMYDAGEISDESMEALGTQHLRTPYNKVAAC